MAAYKKWAEENGNSKMANIRSGATFAPPPLSVSIETTAQPRREGAG